MAAHWEINAIPAEGSGCTASHQTLPIDVPPHSQPVKMRPAIEDLPAFASSTANGDARPRSENQVIEKFASENWQQSLGRAVRKPAELLARLQLSTDLLAAAEVVAKDFPLLVPESYLARMTPGDPGDPLLRQVLPLADEVVSVEGFVTDPVGDHAARRAPGLLHKYQGRALLIAHGSCAVHCRYCFRRQYPYHEEPRSRSEWDAALREIADNPSLTEVILSGGDPLVLSDRRLKDLTDRISAIPHVRRLRIHTRLPIVLPNRVTTELIQLLRTSRPKSVVVVHANHAKELVSDCADALLRLSQSGVNVLNQAVLLRGVNDSADALAELSERCLDLGVIPYYLHQLDRVAGAAHFEVPETVGRELIEELRERLPGYAVPKYVQEIPGRMSKTPLTG